MNKIKRSVPAILVWVVFILFMVHFQIFGPSSNSHMHESREIARQTSHYNPIVRGMVNIWVKYFTNQNYFFLFSILFVYGIIYSHKRAKMELEKLSLLTTPSQIVFRDKSASGHSLDTWGDRLGGARNCLDVIVTPDELITRISFPFCLLFSGSDSNLLNRIKLSNINEINNMKGKKIIIKYHDANDKFHSLKLLVKKKNEFLKSLESDLK